MYNRYIPQPDGTYRRNRINDTPPPQSPPQRPEPVHNEPAFDPPPAPAHPPQPRPRPRPPRPRPAADAQRIGDFLKQLLPRDFNTEDLLIILLLLLMSGDCQEDQNTALLTLAIYLFL